MSIPERAERMSVRTCHFRVPPGVQSGQLSDFGQRLRSLSTRTSTALSHLEPGRPAEPVVPRQAQRRLSAAEAVAVARAYQAGAEMHELAEQYGVHRTNISRCLHSMGVQVRRQGLESEQVLEAARLYCEGWSLARLGERFGCAHTTVRTALLETGVALRSRPGWSG